jgi:hypothetical protein
MVVNTAQVQAPDTHKLGIKNARPNSRMRGNDIKSPLELFTKGSGRFRPVYIPPRRRLGNLSRRAADDPDGKFTAQS